MTNFLKRYWLWLLLTLLGILLIFYFIPFQKYRYLNEDFKKIETLSIITVLILAVILSVLIIIKFIKSKKVSSEFSSLIIIVLGIVSISFFVFKPFIQSGIFLLNGFETNQVVTKKYLVAQVQTDSTGVILIDTQNNKMLLFEKCFDATEVSKLAIKDMVYCEFKKGLFGFIHDPKIKLLK